MASERICTEHNCPEMECIGWGHSRLTPPAAPALENDTVTLTDVSQGNAPLATGGSPEGSEVRSLGAAPALDIAKARADADMTDTQCQARNKNGQRCRAHRKHKGPHNIYGSFDGTEWDHAYDNLVELRVERLAKHVHALADECERLRQELIDHCLAYPHDTLTVTIDRDQLRAQLAEVRASCEAMQLRLQTGESQYKRQREHNKLLDVSLRGERDKRKSVQEACERYEATIARLTSERDAVTKVLDEAFVLLDAACDDIMESAGHTETKARIDAFYVKHKVSR